MWSPRVVRMNTIKRKTACWIGAIILCISLVANAIQFWLVKELENSVVEQSITTAQVELLLRAYDVDLSRQTVVKRLKDKPMGEVEDRGPCWIRVGSSDFYFKGGQYYGSRVAWPEILRTLKIRGHYVDFPLSDCEGEE